MLLDQIKKALKPELVSVPEPPRAGLRHFEREVKEQPVRYHLRVDNDGSGLLIANAAAACRLSPTGVLIAEAVLQGEADEKIAQRVARSFSGAAASTIASDVAKVRGTIDDMAFPGGRYPLFNLDDPGATARGRALAAPLVAEMGIDGSGDPSARIAKLWEVAVPQLVIVHLPGAPAEKLVEGVEKAEDLGLIAGVRAPGTALLADDLLERLVQAGLDHVDVYFAGDEAYHDSMFGAGDHRAALRIFERAKELEMCPVAVIPIVEGGIERLESMIEALPGMGVGAATIFALAQTDDAEPAGGIKAGALRQVMATAEELCDRLRINMVFAPPLERDPKEPLADQVRRGPRAAGEAAIRVTPDGSVIPPQGPKRPVGNLLQQPFEEIWKHEVFRHLRESVPDPEPCDQCPGLGACIRGCPSDPKGWALLDTSEEGCG